MDDEKDSSTVRKGASVSEAELIAEELGVDSPIVPKSRHGAHKQHHSSQKTHSKPLHHEQHHKAHATPVHHQKHHLVHTKHQG